MHHTCELVHYRRTQTRMQILRLSSSQKYSAHVCSVVSKANPQSAVSSSHRKMERNRGINVFPSAIAVLNLSEEVQDREEVLMKRIKGLFLKLCFLTQH